MIRKFNSSRKYYKIRGDFCPVSSKLDLRVEMSAFGNFGRRRRRSITKYKGSVDIARYSRLPVHLFVLHETVWDGSPLFLQIGAFARINENGSAVH